MKRDRTCCDGECRQGRQCPLYEPVQDDMPEATGRVVILIGIVALLVVLAALVR